MKLPHKDILLPGAQVDNRTLTTAPFQCKQCGCLCVNVERLTFNTFSHACFFPRKPGPLSYITQPYSLQVYTVTATFHVTVTTNEQNCVKSPLALSIGKTSLLQRTVRLQTELSQSQSKIEIHDNIYVYTPSTAFSVLSMLLYIHHTSNLKPSLTFTFYFISFCMFLFYKYMHSGWLYMITS